MDIDGGKYYELNRKLLLLIGLWPYDESVFKRVKILTSFSFFISFNVAMIAKIITSKYDMIVTLRALSLIIPCIIVIIKYITFLLIPAGIKKLMKLVLNDWNTLKDMKELETMRNYTNFGRFCTILFSALGCAGVIGIVISVYFPNILNAAPQNFSHGKLPAEVEYFIDEQKYFHVIFCHIYITIILGIITLLATESLYIGYILHACGMFKIASSRLRHAFDQDTLPVSPIIKNAAVYPKIIAAIQLHSRAFEFQDFLWSELAVSYCIILLIGIISLSINLFRAIVIIKDVDELITSGTCVLAHFIYLFCGNYAGQVVIDYSMNVYENICNTRWYHVSLREQKLMLFILHRSMHSCKLLTAGTFTLSLEGFTAILATSISYFTVLSSVQH